MSNYEEAIECVENELLCLCEKEPDACYVCEARKFIIQALTKLQELEGKSELVAVDPLLIRDEVADRVDLFDLNEDEIERVSTQVGVVLSKLFGTKPVGGKSDLVEPTWRDISKLIMSINARLPLAECEGRAKEFCSRFGTKPVEAQWISVEERLPLCDESVLVYDGECQGVSFYDSEYSDWEITPRIGNVTHWQPLPEPPKEES